MIIYFIILDTPCGTMALNKHQLSNFMCPHPHRRMVFILALSTHCNVCVTIHCWNSEGSLEQGQSLEGGGWV